MLRHFKAPIPLATLIALADGIPAATWCVQSQHAPITDPGPALRLACVPATQSTHNRITCHSFTWSLLSVLIASLSQVRLYEVLFKSESPDALGDEWLTDLNPDSLQIINGAFIPPHLAQTAKVGRLRPGY